MSRGGPPRLPGRLARRLLSPSDADRLIDALEDEYRRYQRPHRSRLGADLWYWRQVVRSIPPLRRSRTRGGRDGLSLDLLHLSRKLRRKPASAGATILTLSLALGAGTSVLAVVDAALLRSPPFEDPGALMMLGETPLDEPDAAPRAVEFATLEEWRTRAGRRAELDAYDPTTLALTGFGAAERVSATQVTPGFFALLGVKPVLGRAFDAEDLGRPVAVVSYAFWRGKLTGDPAVIGRSVVLDDEPHTVVGVLPPGFFFALDPGQVWRPFPVGAAELAEDGYPVRVLARIAPGVSPGSLARFLDEASLRSTSTARVRAVPIRTVITGDSGGILGLLAGAAALAMIIAFTNLGVLLIVRSIDRRRELAVRRALGARPSEAARQLVLEALGLVVLGTLGGVVLALWITPAVARFALEFGGLAHRDVEVSWRAVGVVGTAALASACVCGLLSAAGATHVRIADVLRRGRTPSTGELGLRRILVAGEVALAFVLLVSMALLGGSLLRVLAVDPGFDPAGVLKLQVSLPLSRYRSRDRAVAFYDRLQGALEERLGVGTVGSVDELPLTGDGGRGPVELPGTGVGSEAVVRTASPGYFGVMRIPVVAGRPFSAEDDRAAGPRVVISHTLARRLFGPSDPVGRAIRSDGVGTAEVVGVVGDVKHRALEEPVLPTLYLSDLQFPSASSIVVVRSPRPRADVIAIVREEVERLDPAIPVYSIRTLQEVVSASPGVPARRLLTAALAGFALLAVVLSGIGLFGVMAHEVASRREEFALRMALGADPRYVVLNTLGRAALLTSAGLAVGGVLGMGAMRVLGGVLVATGPSDFLGSGAAVAALLLATGAVAALPVATRAARGNVMDTLRIE